MSVTLQNVQATLDWLRDKRRRMERAAEGQSIEPVAVLTHNELMAITQIIYAMETRLETEQERDELRAAAEETT